MARDRIFDLLNRFLHFGAPGGGVAGRLLRHLQRNFAAASGGQTSLPKVQCNTAAGCGFWRRGVLYESSLTPPYAEPSGPIVPRAHDPSNRRVGEV